MPTSHVSEGESVALEVEANHQLRQPRWREFLGGRDRNGICNRDSVFLFFSNRLGCGASALLSLVLTVVLVLVLRGCATAL